MKKYQNFLPKNFHFLVGKFSVYLNRRVFVMSSRQCTFSTKIIDIFGFLHLKVSCGYSLEALTETLLVSTHTVYLVLEKEEKYYPDHTCHKLWTKNL